MRHYERMFGTPAPQQQVESYDVLTVEQIQDHVFSMDTDTKQKFFEQLYSEGWEKQSIGLCVDDVLFRRANYQEVA